MEYLILFVILGALQVYAMCRLARRDFGNFGGVEPGFFMPFCLMACVPIVGTLVVICIWAFGRVESSEKSNWFKNEQS